MGGFSSLLAERFAPHGDLSPQQLEALERHYDLLLRWNQKLNLTRITEIEQAVELHYCESLYIARFLPSTPVTIADIGSGAGFPGIPVAIIRPDCSVTLFEADQRKAVFLKEASRSLANVKVVAMRAGDSTSKYDWCLSRAVASDAVLSSGLSHDYLILGNSGAKLPWGLNRYVLHVPRGT